MKTVKKQHAPVAFNLPAAQAQIVRSESGKEKTVAQIRSEALRITSMPKTHTHEDNLQYDVYSLWNLNFRDRSFAWHTPNGGSRDKAEAMQLKGQGVRSGVPDILIMTRKARMLFIELKNGHHRYDPNQALFAHKAFSYGFEDVFICGSLTEVAALLCHIFDVAPDTLLLR